MSNTSISYILLIVGLIIYFIRPRWVVLYYISLEPIFLPVIALKQGVINQDGMTEIRSIIDSGLAIRLFVVVFVIELFSKYKTIKWSRFQSLLVALLFLCIYLISFYSFHTFTSQLFYSDIRNAILTILPLLLFTINRQLIPHSKQLKTYIFLLVLYQFLWCMLELTDTMHPYLAHYFDDTTYYDGLGEKVSLVCGTFYRYNGMANYLTTIFLALSIDFFYYRRISILFYSTVALLILGMVFISGAKISVVLLFYILIGVCMLNYKKYRLLLFSLVGIIISTYIFLLSFSSYLSDLSGLSGLNRTIEQMANYVQSDSKNDQSTVSHSTFLIDNYFDNPLLGNCYSYKGDRAYWKLRDLQTVKADSRLAYTLVEYGLIGFLIYMFFFLSAIKYAVEESANKKIIVLVFLYFFLLTISEGGFFEFRIVFLYYICAYGGCNLNCICQTKKLLAYG